MHIYQNINDQNKIEFLEKRTHLITSDANGRPKKEKLKEDILKFKYTESQTKQGKEVEFKRSDFERLVKQKMFVKI